MEARKAEYGKLSKKDVNDLQAGARVKVDETVRWITQKL